MTKTLKKNRTLLEFTFWLVTITIIGPIVLLFVKNEYARSYKAWFSVTKDRLIQIYNNLSEDEKDTLHKYLRKAERFTTDEVVNGLTAAGIPNDFAKEIVSAGSKKIKKIIDKEIKK